MGSEQVTRPKNLQAICSVVVVVAAAAVVVGSTAVYSVFKEYRSMTKHFLYIFQLKTFTLFSMY
jgi:hypothetical protein